MGSFLFLLGRICAAASLTAFLACLGTPPVRYSLTVRAPQDGAQPAGCRQVTTHTGRESAPTVNGNRLVFVSDRGGHADLWTMRFGRNLSLKLLDDSSIQGSPALAAADGSVVWMSRAEDARGDIWIGRIGPRERLRWSFRFWPFKKYGPVKLFPYLGYDGQPALSRDGDRVAFVSDRGGYRAVWSGSADGGTCRRVTDFTALQPAWFPDGTRLAVVRPDTARGTSRLQVVGPDGTVVVSLTDGSRLDLHPCVSPDGSRICFTRYAFDTDRDGRISLRDRASIWCCETASGRLCRITGDGYNDTDPVFSADGQVIFFTSDRSGNDDIWAVASAGEVPVAATADSQLMYARTMADTARPHYNLMLYENVWQRFPGSDAAAEAMLEAALLCRRTGFMPEFRSFCAAIAELPGAGAAVRYLARLRLVESDTSAAYADREAQLDMIWKLSGEARVRSRILEVRAGIALAAGEDDRVLELCGRVLDEFDGEQAVCARIRLLMGTVYERFGNRSQILGNYLSLINDYPQQTGAVREACGRVTALLAGAGGAEPSPALYREVLQQYGSYAALAAYLRYRTAGLLQDVPEEAVGEYLQIVRGDGLADEYYFKGRMAAAALLEGLGKPERAERLLRETMDSAPDGCAATAKRQLLDLLCKRGDALIGDRDLELALSKFLSAATIDYNEPRAHRGIIVCYNAAGRIPELMEKYRNRLYYHPESAIDHYTLGSAYTYLYRKNDRKHNRKIFRLAEKHLNLSRQYDPNNPYVYLTLGWLFQQMEIQGLNESRLYEKAIENLRMGMVLNDENRDQQLEADFCLNIANNCLKLADWKTALEYYNRALALRISFRNPVAEMTFYENRAGCFYKEDALPEAIDNLRSALGMAETLSRQRDIIKFDQTIAYYYQMLAEKYREWATLYNQQAKFDKAKELLDKADLSYDESIAFIKKAMSVSDDLALSEPDQDALKERQNNQLWYMGYNYGKLGEYDEAIQWSQSAMEVIASGVLTESVDPRANRTYLRFFNNENLDLYLPGFISIDLTIGASESEGFSLVKQQSRNYTIKGEAQVGKGAFLEAVSSYKQKLKIERDLKDAEGEAISLNNIGILYYRMYDREKAREYFGRSLAVCRRGNFTYGEMADRFNLGYLDCLTLFDAASHGREISLQTVRTAQRNCAAGLAAAGAPPDSLRFLALEAALAVASLQMAARNRLVLFPDRLNGPAEAAVLQGMVAESWARASVYTGRALELARRLGYRKTESVLLSNSALLSRMRGDFRAAGRSLREARAIADRYGFDEVQWRISHHLARVLRDDDDTANDGEIFPLLEEAAALRENLVTGNEYRQLSEQPALFADRMEKTVRSDAGQTRDLYRDIVAWLMDREEYARALDYLERGKGQETARLLTRNGLGFIKQHLATEMDKNNLGWVMAHQADIVETELGLRRELLEAGATPRADSLRTRLAAARTRLDGQYRAMEEQRPELLAFIHPRRVNPDDIRDRLAPAAAALVYATGPDRLFIWVITREEINALAVPLPDGLTGLSGLVDRFRRSIMTEADLSLVHTDGTALYGLLIQPVLGLLDGITSLVIVPDGVLYGIPWAALYDGSQYLMASCAVATAPSLAYWRDCHDRRSINQDRLLVASNRPPGGGTPYGSAFGGDLFSDIRMLDGAAVAPESLAQYIRDYDCLHLELAARMDPRIPLQSYLMAGERGWHLYDAMEVPLRASQMVLLFTGLDRPVREEEWTTLCYAFGYAGVPGLVHNLWITDRSRMEAGSSLLYRYLKELPLDQALGEMKYELSEQYAHPYFWAGWRLVGYGGMDRSAATAFAQERLNRVAQLGFAAQKRKRFEDAFGYFQTALSMATTLDKNALIPKIYNALVFNAYSMQGYGKAVYYQEKLLDLVRQSGTPAQEAAALNTLARCRFKAGQLDAAVAAETACRTLYAESGDLLKVAGSHRTEAIMYQESGEFDRAETAAVRALETFRTAADRAGEEAASLLVGILYLNRNRDHEALAHLTRHAGYYITDSTSAQAARVWQLLGYAYEKTGNYADAVTWQQKALAIFTGAGDTQQAGTSCQYLANSYWYRGDFANAFKYQNMALAAARKTDNTTATVRALTTLGLIHLSIAQTDQALELQRQAAALARESGETAELAAVYNNLGLVYRQLAKERLALKNFSEALSLDEQLGLERGMGYDYRNIGISYERLGDPVSAQSYYEKALAASRKTGNRENEAKTLFGLGSVSAADEDDARALEHYFAALELSRMLDLKDVQWRALRGIGSIYERKKRFTKARDMYDDAITVIEKMRAQLKIEKYKTGFMDDKADVYEDMIRFLLQNDRVEEAFNFAERAKSRNFIDLLGNQGVAQKRQADRDLLEREKKLKSSIEILGRRLFAAREPEERRELEGELQGAKSDYEDLLQRIEAQSPALASMVRVHPATVTELRGYLEPGSALVEYFLTGERILIWVIDQERVGFRQVSVKDRDLVALVNDFRQRIKAVADVEEVSRRLYDVLIGPAADLLDGKQRLCIVPHGALHYLPFAALPDEKGTYLLEKYSLYNVPSASVLRYCVKPEQPGRNRVLAFGNPDLHDEGFDLPFAEKEVQSIRFQYPDSRSYLRADATETAAREYAPAYPVIHFACHGEFDRENPLFSGLLLASDDRNNGRLEVHEIFGLDLHADLVMLSACETGLGKIEKGDDVVGLTRAFIYAGSSSIIASLWKISDVASAVLVKRFYRYLKKESKADALREAQLFIKKKYKHPAYWASFVLTGDAR